MRKSAPKPLKSPADPLRIVPLPYFERLTMNMNDISSALFDAYDVRNALSARIKNRPKDNEGTDTTIGDCLNAIIETLEQLEATHV